MSPEERAKYKSLMEDLRLTAMESQCFFPQAMIESASGVRTLVALDPDFMATPESKTRAGSVVREIARRLGAVRVIVVLDAWYKRLTPEDAYSGQSVKDLPGRVSAMVMIVQEPGRTVGMNWEYMGAEMLYEEGAIFAPDVEVMEGQFEGRFSEMIPAIWN